MEFYFPVQKSYFIVIIKLITILIDVAITHNCDSNHHTWKSAKDVYSTTFFIHSLAG